MQDRIQSVVETALTDAPTHRLQSCRALTLLQAMKRASLRRGRNVEALNDRVLI